MLLLYSLLLVCNRRCLVTNTHMRAAIIMRLLRDYYVIHIPCLSYAYPLGVITGW